MEVDHFLHIMKDTDRGSIKEFRKYVFKISSHYWI